MVIREKKMDLVRKQVEAFYESLKPGTDLLEAAKGVPNITARKTGPFKATDAPQGVGRDLAFTEVAVRLNVGELSKPFEGTRGYYIMKLTSKSPFDSTQYASQKAALRDQILQEKRSRFSSDWLASLREKAEIEDNRERFFR